MQSLLSFALLSAALLISSAAAQTSSMPAKRRPWWKPAVIYEIYPRSFADSNNDGVGDLNGITSKLDYLKDLGVDAIWISPCFPSPQVDFGYDVSDYLNIDPMYGTLADFDRLAAEAKKRNIRIILDFVINHTSDQHKWFLDSRSSRTSPFRDWYVWRDGKNGGPPNNWISIFGGSSWKWDDKTKQYYYHAFYPEQPDLNWRNPAVKKAMFDVTRWWYKRGASGFRLDAVDTMFEDPQLRDDPSVGGTNAYGDPVLQRKYDSKLPEVHTALRELRKVADEHDAVLVGETWTNNISELKQYYGVNNDEVQLPMNFLFCMVNKLSAPEFRKQIGLIETSGRWPVFVISNHDIVRSWDRYGDGKNNDAIAKLMAAMYLTLRGTAVMYYGEEIGMETTPPTRVEDVKDPIGKKGWPKEKGRDGERTPMQWTSGKNGGFSNARPWLPVPPNAANKNVENQLKDANSILRLYQRLLALRKENRAIRDGSYIPLNQTDPNVLTYLRRAGASTVLVALNMSGSEQKVKLNLAHQGLGKAKGTSLLDASATARPVGEMTLPPFGVYVGQLK